MVFSGGWRPGRRNGPPYDGDPNQPYDPYQQGYGPQYRRGFGGGGFNRGGFNRGFGGGGFGGGGGSCLRDALLLETGCCLAEGLGCGPQLLLLAPRLARRTDWHASAHRLGLRDRFLGWVLAMISGYQRDISAKRPAVCRFTPSCSHYAAEALETHGLRRGAWLALRRLLRCHPWSAGGVDPVPHRY
jgi:putative membrane protein insertion efficiency factor